MKREQLDLHASHLSLDSDWDEAMQAFWDSWKNPLQASGELTFPNLATGTLEEEEAFNKTKQDLLHEAKANPGTVVWLKCTDVNASKIVGGMYYRIERKWPESGVHFTGCGFKPGSELQELSDSFYRQLLWWRRRIMKGEHIYGQSFFVLPEYRATGAGKMLLDLAAQDADRLSMEAFTEGTTLSAPGFMRSGFIVVAWTNMVFHRDDPSENWKRLVSDIQSHPIAICWRPKQGRYIEGKTVLPWSGKAREAKL